MSGKNKEASLETKRMMADTLKSLMQRKTLDNVTVKDIVTICGVNRQTFYYHFEDLVDLIEWIFKMEGLEKVQNYRKYETWQQCFQMILEYVSENLNFCMNCFNSWGRSAMDRFFYDLIFDLITGMVDDVTEGYGMPPQKKKFVANFYTYAFIGVMIQWIRDGAKEKPEDIIRDIGRLIEGDMHQVIRRYYDKDNA